MLPPCPLRTVRESFPSYGSSLHERPSRDAAGSVRRSCAWICRWQLACNNSRLSNVSCPPRLRQIRWWMCQSSSASAGFARRPRTSLLAPSIGTRSGPDLQACGSISSQPFFQVQFPRRIVRVGFAPDLHLPDDLHLRRFHQLDRPALAFLSRSTPVKTQWRCPSRWKYFFLIHFRLLFRCRCRHHRHSIRKIR